MADTLTEKELAERWKMTARTLQGWRAKGIGPRFIRIGERSIFYRRSDVEAYEASNVVGRAIPPEGWENTVKRAAGALNLLAKKAAKPEVQKTLNGLRDELHALIA
jgi:predicted DNA-binding transcriptional regulator AlpA